MNFTGKAGAHISECKKFRYSLWRRWDEQKPLVMFVCLNPSTADALNNDPTLNRCIDFSRNLGFGGILLGNLFAYRATQIEVMLRQKDPIGPENDLYLKEMSKRAEFSICAWGNHGLHLGRSEDVLKILDKVFCLKINKSGQPSHPLYLKSDLRPIKLPV